MKDNGVIIIGGRVQGLGLLRTFAKKNIQSIIIHDRKLDIIMFSKYCKNHIVFKEIDNSKKLTNFLINIAKNKGLNNWTILPTTDSVVRILSKNK